MNTAQNYLDSLREYLSEYAGAQIMFAWASMALEQGSDPEEIQYKIMSYTIKGG